MSTPDRDPEVEAILAEAEATGKWIRVVRFEDEYSPKQLRALRAKGAELFGASWLVLIDRPNFTEHQGEYDTITLEEHNARKRVTLEERLACLRAEVASTVAEIAKLGGTVPA